MESKGKIVTVPDAFCYEEEEVLCYCGLKAARRISRTAGNPNRKFFGCPLFSRSKDNKSCDYFEWFDIRAAVFKATAPLSEMVSMLESENRELRSLLQRVMKDGSGKHQPNEFVVELELIKQRIQRLELEGTSRK
ncbi:unnamed protein product [Linum trigynum]|uniref:GRF-type domain-containing protein n=1 Tax=Linum trigynum TaxID=586398 RepID=A0AAV2GI83_9ROSI